MIALLQIIGGLAVLFCTVAAAVWIVTRQKKELPPGLTLSERLLPPPKPPQEPNLYDLAGILTVKREDGSESPQYVEKDGHTYALNGEWEINPDLLGHFLADFHTAQWKCGYCQKAPVMIEHVQRKKTPEGARDQGVSERVYVGTYCTGCGVLLNRFPHRKKDEIPQPFRSTNHLPTALKLLAEENGKLTKEIRYRLLCSEHARVQSRADALARAIQHLYDELHPRTDVDPFRGTPLKAPQNDQT